MGNLWKVILATVVIFGTGVITGGLLVNFSEKAKPVRPKRQPEQHLVPLWPPPRGLAQGRSPEVQTNLERQTSEFVLNIDRELNLTSAQRERVERIVREGQEQTRETWTKIAPELRKQMNEVREKIRAELTTAQRAHFDEILKQRQRRRTEETGGPARPQRDGRQPQSLREASPGSDAPRPARRTAPANP